MMAFAEPQAVHEGHRVHEDVRAMRPLGPAVELVPGMQVDQPAMFRVAVQHLAGAQHDRAVVRDVVEIDAGAGRVFAQELQALDVVVVEAAHRLGEDAHVLRPGLVPRLPVVAAEVLLAPRMPAALAIHQQLVAHAAQGENLGRPVREFAHRVIVLHPHAQGLGGAAKVPQAVPGEEGIVDVGIQPIALMYVHNVGGGLLRVLQILGVVVRHATRMEIPVAPLLRRAQRMERRDQQIKVEVQRLARLERARPAEAHQPAVRPGHAALAPAAPRRRIVQRTPRVMDIHAGADVVLGLQYDAQAAVNRAEPHAVLMLVGDVPLPVERRGRGTGLLLQADHQGGRRGGARGHQSNIGQFHRAGGSAERDAIAQRSVELHPTLQFGGGLAEQEARRPFDHTRRGAGEGEAGGLGADSLTAGRDHLERHRFREQFQRGFVADAGDRRVEEAGDADGQAVSAQFHFAAEAGDGASGDLQRRVALRGFVIDRGGRVEPAQARHALRIGVVLRRGRPRHDLDGEGKALRLGGCGCGENFGFDLARGGVGGRADHAPEGLNPAQGQVVGFGEGAAQPVDAVGGQAGEPGGVFGGADADILQLGGGGPDHHLEHRDAAGADLDRERGGPARVAGEGGRQAVEHPDRRSGIDQCGAHSSARLGGRGLGFGGGGDDFHLVPAVHGAERFPAEGHGGNRRGSGTDRPRGFGGVFGGLVFAGGEGPAADAHGQEIDRVFTGAAGGLEDDVSALGGDGGFQHVADGFAGFEVDDRDPLGLRIHIPPPPFQGRLGRFSGRVDLHNDPVCAESSVP